MERVAQPPHDGRHQQGPEQGSARFAHQSHARRDFRRGALEGNQQHQFADHGDHRRADVAEPRDQHQVGRKIEDHSCHERRGQQPLPASGDEHVLGQPVGVAQRQIADQDDQGDRRIGQVFASADQGDDWLGQQGRTGGEWQGDLQQESQPQAVRLGGVARPRQAGEQRQGEARGDDPRALRHLVRRGVHACRDRTGQAGQQQSIDLEEETLQQLVQEEWPRIAQPTYGVSAATGCC
jgi:hypothetical protein